MLLVSLFEETKERQFLDEAQWVVREVDRVLGQDRGLRIGQQPERDGQYFHYHGMRPWMGCLRPGATEGRPIGLVRVIAREMGEEALTRRGRARAR